MSATLGDLGTRWTLRALLVAGAAACTGRGEKAAGARPGAATDFNADSAMGYVRQQVAFGPRVPGTEAHRKAGDWIVAHLRTVADTVIEQSWSHTTSEGGTLPLRNILARFKPGSAERVLYVSHWDSRPVAERESEPAKQDQAIPGANDGASSTALLMGVADALRRTPPGVGVDLLFVDGEDWGDFGPPLVDVLLGSTYFAKHFPEPGYRPLFGVLWDMIGDSDLEVRQEINSVDAAPEVVRRVWNAAKAFGYDSYFSDEARDRITDDHVPLIAAGLRVIDVIDIDYECHHMLCDTVDKVSAKSLKVMGDVALSLVR